MSRSVEQRHAIQKSARPMDQMEYQGIIWVIKADADKRIAELETVLEMIRDYIAGGLESEDINEWIDGVLEGGTDDKG